MPAYVAVEVEVLDQARYEAYKKLVPASLEAYGGRFLVHGGKVENLEGDWWPERFVIVEFALVERAKEWWNSPDMRRQKRCGRRPLPRR